MDAGLAALLGAGIGALAVIGTTITASRRHREESIRSARRDAYLDVLEMCHVLLAWAHATNPMIAYAGAPPPVYPDIALRLRVAAQVKLYGSPQVRQQFAKFQAWLVEFQQAADTINFVRDLRTADRPVPESLSTKETEAWSRLPTLRTELEEKVDSLSTVMRRDVLGEDF